MNSKYYIYLFLFSTLFISCKHKEKIYSTKYNGEIYKATLSSFPKQMVEHFPELDEGNVKMLEITTPGAYMSYIYLIMSFPEEKIETIKRYAIEKNIDSYSFKDSCLLIVNLKKGSNLSFPFLSTTYHSSIDKLPIPNFAFCHESNIDSCFYSNSTIYVLNAEKGKVFNDNNLSVDDLGLPLEWKHGYSKGIVLSEISNTAIYWLEIW